MFWKCCFGAPAPHEAETVRPANAPARPAPVAPVDTPPGASLDALIADGSHASQRMLDAHFDRTMRLADRELRRLEARNARQMAKLTQALDAQTAAFAPMHEALERLAGPPFDDAELLAQLEHELEDDIAREAR